MGYVSNYSTYQITTKIRDKIVNNIRRLLTGDPKYTYIELPNGDYDFANTRVIISDIVPQSSIFYPAIIVESLGGDEERYIGPDTLNLVKNNSHVVTDDKLFTSIKSTVAINIYTIDDTIARDELTDLIYNNFKYTNDDLANAGIEIFKTHFPVHAQAYAEGRWYLTGRITMELYSEWNGSLGTGNLLDNVTVSFGLESQKGSVKITGGEVLDFTSPISTLVGKTFKLTVGSGAVQTYTFVTGDVDSVIHLQATLNSHFSGVTVVINAVPPNNQGVVTFITIATSNSSILIGAGTANSILGFVEGTIVYTA